MEQKERKSFVFYRDWYETICKLDDSTALELCKSIMSIAFGEEPEEMSQVTNAMMMLIRPQIERDRDKWLDVKEKRKESGKLGGLANASKTKQMPPNAKDDTKCRDDVASDSKTKQIVEKLPVDVNADVYVDVDGEEESEHSSSKKDEKNKKTFTPPTLDEVRSYIKKKGYHIDARSFIDYYEADDWYYKNGGKRCKVNSWKRCLSTWENTYRTNHPEESNEPQKEEMSTDDVLVQKFLGKIASGEITLEQESRIYGNVLEWWLYEATETNRNYWRNVYREKIIEWMKSHAE